MLRPLLAALLLAGCLGAPPPAQEPTAPPPAFEEAFLAQEGHDHARDPHGFAWGLEIAATFPRARMLEGEAAQVSDLQFQGALAAVAVRGGSGGFVLLDAREAPELRVLGRYRSGSEDNWYVKFTPDGRHVLLTANGGLSPAGGAQGATAGLLAGTPAGPLRGLHVVDVTDPARPVLVGVHPAPVRLVNVAIHEAEGQRLVFASVVEDRLPDAPRPGTGLSNHVALLRWVEGPGNAVRLEEVARWAPPAGASPMETFPHDLAVETHPVTGRTLLYAAFWRGGAWIVDVTDPARPQEIGHVALPRGLPADTFKPHPGLVEGRHLAIVGTETFAGEESGPYLLVDATDPAAPLVLDAWTLPGNPVSDVNLLWSPHEFTLAEGKAYVSQFHGGAGVLSLAGGRLTPLAWWAAAYPGEAPPQRFSPDVETFVRHGAHAYALDMEGGVLALRETG